MKKRLEFVENELKYQRELAERKAQNKKLKKKHKLQIPIINRNDLG
ncbi:MAG: hypothetical protein GY793_06365 [Proteobacteria bacterium]|nr:hypothetical protein [Pseudomonadota bacterium]